MLEIRVSDGFELVAGENGTIEVTSYVDGTATDGTSPTVEVDYASGTEAVASKTPTTNGGTDGVLAEPMGTTVTGNVNRLVATWGGTWESVAQTWTTYHEIVGRPLFTLDRARSFDGSVMSNTTTYPTVNIMRARSEINDLLERWTGVAWVPRFRRVSLPGTGYASMQLPNVQVNTILSVTINGTSITATNFTMDNLSRTLYRTDGVFTSPDTSNPLNVTLEYEHGYQYPRESVEDVALTLLRDGLVQSPIGDRATSYNDELGTYAFRVIPGMGGAVSNIDFVNEFVKRNAQRHMTGF